MVSGDHHIRKWARVRDAKLNRATRHDHWSHAPHDDLRFRVSDRTKLRSPDRR